MRQLRELRRFIVVGALVQVVEDFFGCEVRHLLAMGRTTQNRRSTLLLCAALRVRCIGALDMHGENLHYICFSTFRALLAVLPHSLLVLWNINVWAVCGCFNPFVHAWKRKEESSWNSPCDEREET